MTTETAIETTVEPITNPYTQLCVLHSADIGKFAVPRLKAGIRWWEDVLANGGGPLYGEEILKKYPVTW